MNILAIDQATKTGWASNYDGDIHSGVVDFSTKRNESKGMIYVNLRKWLSDGHFYIPRDLIIFEQPHNRGGAPTQIGNGLVAIIQAFAAENGIDYTDVHSGTLKKFTTGKGNATKADMMAWFKDKIGRDPISDDEADAMAMLYYAMDKYQPKGGK